MSDGNFSDKVIAMTDRESAKALFYLWGKFEGDKEFMQAFETIVDRIRSERLQAK